MTATSPDNTEIINRLSKKLLPVFTGKVLPVLFLTIIMVFYSRKLSYNDYGQFQTVWIYTNILSVIISFGISSVILSSPADKLIRFLQKNSRLLFLLYSIGGVVSGTIFYFTSFHFAASTRLLLILFVVLQCACTLVDTLLIKRLLLTIYVWVNVCYSILFFSIHVYFLYHPFVLNQLILAIICLSALKATAIFCIRLQPAPGATTDSSVAIGSSWIFLGLNEIAGIIARWLDKLFLLYLLSPAEFAIFFNGAFEIPLFAILISAMENVLLTLISANPYDKLAARRVFRESFKILSLIAFPIFFLLLTAGPEAFSIIFNNKYNASLPVFLVSIFIIPVRITHYGVILQCYGQSRKIAFGSLLDILFSLLLMFILYPLMGTPGVALAIVVSTYLQAWFYTWQSAKIMSLGTAGMLPGAFLIKFWLLLTALYGLLYWLKKYFTSTASLAIISAVTIIIIVAGLVRYWTLQRVAEKI